MNFLQICQRIRQEVGGPGNGPASVIGQTGDNKRYVEWAISSDEDIQSLYSDWEFLRGDFDFTTTIDQQAYTPTQAGVPELNQWRVQSDASCYLTTSNEQWLTYLPWDLFKQTYLFGTARDLTGRPGYYSIKPDKSIILHPTPDAEYHITGEYYKRAQSMAVNADEPIFPSQFHMIVVWRALMFYGAFDAADEKYTHGQNEYKRLLRALKMDQRPKIEWGPPLV